MNAQNRITTSLLSSLAIVSAMVVAEGLTLFALGIDWGYRLDHYEVHVRDVETFDAGQSLISISVLGATYREGCTYQLGFHRLPVRGSLSRCWTGSYPYRVVAVPNTSRAVISCATRALYTVDMARPWLSPVLLSKDLGGADSLTCSSDGRYLLSCTTDALHCFDLQTSKWLWQRTGCLCAAFHPDARRIVSGLDDGNLVEMDPRTGGTLRRIAQLSLLPIELQVAPDGESVAAMCGERDLVLCDLETGAVRWSINQGHSRFCFSPGGDVLVSVVCRDARWLLRLTNVHTGEELGTLAGHTRRICGAKFSSDGRLFSWGTDGTIRQWDLEARKELRTIFVNRTIVAGDKFGVSSQS